MNAEENKEPDTMPPAPKRKFEEEEVGDVRENGLDEQDESAVINRKQLWLLCQNKYCLTFHLCPSCNGKLFKRTDKVKEGENGVMVSFELCWNCVRRNMGMSEIARGPSAKKYKK